MLGVRRYRTLFSNRAVALLVTALVFSRIGDQFVGIGLTWTALELTHSTVATGLIVMAYALALIAAGFFAGSLLDRYPRKPLMLLDNGLRVLCIGAIAAAGLTHHLSVWLLVVLACMAAVASTITVVGTRAYLPTLVPEELIITVFAVDSSLYQVAAIAGPALASLVTAGFGASWSMAAGAACFALFVTVAAFIPQGALDEGIPPEAKPVTVDEELRGVRYVFEHPVLRAVTVLTAVANFFVAICIFGLVFLSKITFVTGPLGQGLMLTVLAIGSLVASVLMGAGQWRYPRGISFVGSSVVCGVLLAVIAIAPSLPVACVVLFLFGAVDAAFFIWMSELRQRTPPPELLARVISASMILNTVAVPFGNAATGFAVSALGVRPMYAAAGGLLAVYSALFLRNKPLRETA
jgi:predicted MFS family arabinose efflux permease